MPLVLDCSDILHCYSFWNPLPRAPFLFILAIAHFGEKKKSNRNHTSRHLVAEKRDSLNCLAYFLRKKELISIVAPISYMTLGKSFLHPRPQNSPICTMRLLDYDESVAGLARDICSKSWKQTFSCPDSSPKLTESTPETWFRSSHPLHPVIHIRKIKITKWPISQEHWLNCLLNVNTMYDAFVLFFKWWEHFSCSRRLRWPQWHQEVPVTLWACGQSSGWLWQPGHLYSLHLWGYNTVRQGSLVTTLENIDQDREMVLGIVFGGKKRRSGTPFDRRRWLWNGVCEAVWFTARSMES